MFADGLSPSLSVSLSVRFSVLSFITVCLSVSLHADLSYQSVCMSASSFLKICLSVFLCGRSFQSVCQFLCIVALVMLSVFLFSFFSSLVADTRLYTLPCRSVHRSVRNIFESRIREWFLHFCSCPTIRDCPSCCVSGLVFSRF